MVIDKELLDSLTKSANADTRLRKDHVLRKSAEDLFQRILNVVEPEPQMPIRHPNTSTTVVIIRGAIKQNFYDDEANLTESVILDSDGEIRAVQVENGRWHNLESLKSGSVLFEAKDGAWGPYVLLNKRITNEY